MKRLSFGVQIGSFEEWTKDCFKAIERASNEDIEAVLSEFSITGTLTERRTINAGTATTDEVRDFVCTMINDIKKRGQKRTNG